MCLGFCVNFYYSDQPIDGGNFRENVFCYLIERKKEHWFVLVAERGGFTTKKTTLFLVHVAFFYISFFSGKSIWDTQIFTQVA